MTSGSRVQSVSRALQLLRETARHGAVTIGHLHRCSGLPKPTIVRLMRTLAAEGYVTNDVRQGGYKVTSQVATLSGGFYGDALAVEAGRPWALELTRQLLWPVGLAVFDNDAVKIRYSTVQDSPISPFQAIFDMRLSLLSHAMGRAYLAFCPEEECIRLIDILSASTEKKWAKPSKREIHSMLLAVRAQGFAERDPRQEPKKSNTLAVPIIRSGKVLATIGISYFRSSLTKDAAAARLVPPLKHAAGEIEKSIDAIQSSIGEFSAAELQPRKARNSA